LNFGRRSHPQEPPKTGSPRTLRAPVGHTDRTATPASKGAPGARPRGGVEEAVVPEDGVGLQEERDGPRRPVAPVDGGPRRPRAPDRGARKRGGRRGGARLASWVPVRNSGGCRGKHTGRRGSEVRVRVPEDGGGVAIPALVQEEGTAIGHEGLVAGGSGRGGRRVW